MLRSLPITLLILLKFPFLCYGSTVLYKDRDLEGNGLNPDDKNITQNFQTLTNDIHNKNEIKNTQKDTKESIKNENEQEDGQEGQNYSCYCYIDDDKVYGGCP
ncbi:10296_t:CDS:2, partial [Cetraspora pellucida]